MDEAWPDPRIRRALEEHLVPEARAELLRVLTALPDVRADVIRQSFQRPGGESMEEVLIDLEEDDFVRAAFIETLGSMQAEDS